MNRYPQNTGFHAAGLVLLVGGSVAAALLLPSKAVPESRVETAAPRAALTATARLNFKIIVPKILYMQVGNTNDRALGAQTVAVMSNSHNATLNATLRSVDSNAPARGNLILSSAARKPIEQNAQCTLGPSRSAAATSDSRVRAQQVVCTVSMP